MEWNVEIALIVEVKNLCWRIKLLEITITVMLILLDRCNMTVKCMLNSSKDQLTCRRCFCCVVKEILNKRLSFAVTSIKKAR